MFVKGEKMRKNRLIVFFLVSLTFSLLFLFVYNNDFLSNNQDSNTYLSIPQSSATHSQIYIEGNAALDSFCSGNGTDGTFLNPHIIENYLINASGTGSAIEIRNSDRYLIIRYCTLSDSGSQTYDAGIELYYSSNIRITQSSVYSNRNGISLYYSNNNTIMTNNISGNSRGIFIENSNYNTIMDNNASYNTFGIYLYNTDYSKLISNNVSDNNNYGIYLYNSDYSELILNNLSDNNDYGIYFFDSNNNLVTGNYMTKCGLFFHTSFNNSVDTTNLVNNNSVYYFEDKEALIIDGDVFKQIGQLILVNCSNAIISNLDLTNEEGEIVALLLSYSNNNLITGNNVLNYKYGISLSYSNNNSITGNNVLNNQIGISLSDSNNNMLTGNNASNNYYHGIRLYNSDYSELILNNISDNHYGIYLSHSHSSELISNNVLNNNRDGIMLYISFSNFISQNDVSNNNHSGITIERSDYNKINGNRFSFNLQNGMWLDIADYNEIIGNIITDNYDYGICINRLSTDNDIYFNNIEENVNDEVLSGLNGQHNKWDNGSIGNYYGNYVYLYPEATVNGPVWDTPYDLGFDQDDFPLVYPYGHDFVDFSSNNTNPVLNANIVQFFFEGIIFDDIKEFQWNFGDGTANSTDRNPVHIFDSFGYYTITLTVFNSTDIVGVAVKNDFIQFENLIPEANFSVDYKDLRITNNVAHFSYSGSEGDFPIEYQWNFGDGSTNSTEANPYHTFSSFGNYTITLTVVDINGDNDVIVKKDYILYTNLHPIADFTVDSTISIANLIVNFTYTGSGGDYPLTFQWNFGDGTENSTFRNPLHIFTQVGIFTITLTVTDINGDISYIIKENYIQVKLTDTNPTANFLVTVGIIIGVCGAAGIGVFAYKRKSKVALKVSKDGSEIKSVTIQIETLSKLFKSSDSVKIQEAAELIGLSRVEFLNFLIDNRSSLTGLTIDGDILSMNTEEDVNEFINLLDEQFETWKNKEKSKVGKN